MKATKLYGVLGLMTLTQFTMNAAPIVRPFPAGTMLSALSDNGNWGVSNTTGEDEEGLTTYDGGTLWNTADMTATNIAVPTNGYASLGDVTDNGKLIVGSANGKPAYYDLESKQWHTLPLPAGTVGGMLVAVTPDGSRAVGYANKTSEWDAVPVIYDLKAEKLIELKKIPTENMNHDEADYSAFAGISADGRYVIGRLSQEVLMPVSMCAYVYDTQTDEVNFIGFTPSNSTVWTAHAPNLAYIDDAIFSCDGAYVTGAAYMVQEVEGSEWANEYRVAYRYDVINKQFEVYDGVYDSDIMGFTVTNSGTVLASTPAVNPYSSMVVRSGKYYYGLDEIYSQAYGLNFYDTTGQDITGKPAMASADGHKLVMITAPTECYYLEVDEDWDALAAKVNLLSSHSVTPAPGSIFSAISNVKVTFTRNVEVSGAASNIYIADENGTKLRSASKIEADGSTVSISFRPYSMEAGKSYTVVIPEGMVSMVGDLKVSCTEIKATYQGRAAGAVAATQFSPAAGSTFSRIDASTNPVYVTFNASILLKADAKGELWRKGESAPFAELDLSPAGDNVLAVYPLTRQYLFDGTEYQVVIPAGVVTDLGGEGGNEKITIDYSGNYVREISADDKTLFSSTCDNYEDFMLYDGDKLKPANVPAGWGFTADMPWYIVRTDTESADMAYASHSMYTTAGKADDWCVTPQIYIPDSQCYMTFDAQSYKKDKADRLKVYIYESGNVYSTITKEIADDIRANGVLAFDEQLSAGKSDEGLEGDWQNYMIDLKDYSGKSIYIAFVNDNEAQSAVFIDNVEVIHDMMFLISVTSPEVVVAQNSVEITGDITVASEIHTINSITLELVDPEQKCVSKISESGLNITNGHSYSFRFPEKLPLKPNTINNYGIKLQINNDNATSMMGSIKNMAFDTQKRIVVEEYSGRECSNCPLGFVAMENLERLFPGRVLPIVIRTYQSDPLGQGMNAYTSFLGHESVGAPYATLNREYSCAPMVSVGMDYRLSGEGVGAFTWLDAAIELMKTPADADVTFTANYDAASGQINVAGEAIWGLNNENVNANIFCVVTEDKLSSLQLNGFYTVDDPDLGEWGNGGSLAQQVPTIEIDGVARGAYGRNFNGTGGMLPSTVKAGEPYSFTETLSMPSTVANPANTNVIVMLIDADTDRVINAQTAKVSAEGSINEVETIGNGIIEYYDLQGRKVMNPAKGQLLLKRHNSKVTKIIY